MCVTDIVEFIGEYIAGETYVNCGEFFYEHNDEIENFAENLISALKEKFKEGNINSVKISDSTVITKIHDKEYECFIYQSGVGGVDYWGHGWSVIPLGEEE